MRKLLDLAPADDGPGQVLAPPAPRTCPECRTVPLQEGEERCALCEWLDEQSAKDLRPELGR